MFIFEKNVDIEANREPSITPSHSASSLKYIKYCKKVEFFPLYNPTRVRSILQFIFAFVPF